jgi:adenylyltransferase/sulfurtransferase
MTKRYDRQEIIRGWDQKSLSDGSVLILGAGTTGNEIIKNLALLGVGHIVIVDRDLVEEINLNRCVLFRSSDIGKPKAAVAAQRALELNPLIRAEAWNLDIVHEIGCLEYKDFKCVVLTVDNLRARMWVNRYCWQLGIPLINTGIEGWTGNVFVMLPSSKACLECSWTTKEYQHLGEEHSCSKIGLIFNERKIPMVITSAAIVGGIAVQEIIKILQGLHSSTSLSKDYWWFDGETGAILSWSQPSKASCVHDDYPRLNLSEILCSVSLSETVDSARERIKLSLGSSMVEIKHDKEIVYSISCRQCGYTQTIKPILLEKYLRFVCPKCGFLETVPDDFGEDVRDGYTFSDLGIPPNHLLRVYYDKGDTVEKTLIATRR